MGTFEWKRMKIILIDSTEDYKKHLRNFLFLLIKIITLTKHQT